MSNNIYSHKENNNDVRIDKAREIQHKMNNNDRSNYNSNNNNNNSNNNNNNNNNINKTNNNSGIVNDAVPCNTLPTDQYRSIGTGVTKGCRVELALHYGIIYGTVVWIGPIQSTGMNLLWVGIETDTPHPSPDISPESNGIKNSCKLFYVKPNHGLILPSNKCPVVRDLDCSKLPLTSITGAPNKFDPLEATILNNCIKPISDLNSIVGNKKGIQGCDNSCYMDASLFGMFCFNDTFDHIFLKSDNDQQNQKYDVVKKILKTRIVYPLRYSKFVRSDQVLLLRHKLDEVGVVDGLTYQEKDPEEFLTCLLQHVLNIPPLLHFNSTSGRDKGFFYQIFVERYPNYCFPNIQMLLEQSFVAENILLKEVPQLFLIQMPRDGKDFRIYPHILPSLELDLSTLVDSIYSPNCILCQDPAEVRCSECEKEKLFNSKLCAIYYCKKCFGLFHDSSKIRQDHLSKTLPAEPKHTIPTKQKLFAVLCIERSHYVCFAKCGLEWVMFDSMSDRILDEYGERNVPAITHCPKFEDWLTNPKLYTKLTATDAKTTVPPFFQRLTKDLSFCMYCSHQGGLF